MSQTSSAIYPSLPFADNFRLAALVSEGLPARLVKELALLLGITPQQFAAVAQIAPRTLMRRLSSNARLKPDESERALRIGRLLHQAAEVFEDKESAATWFRRPLRTLSGRTPLELCATEPGAREVEALLGRISHGVFE